MGEPANRLREAREYVGFSVAEVERCLRFPAGQLDRAEAGQLRLWDDEIEKLARLYRRPVGYLRGEPVPPVEIPPDLAQLMEDKAVSDHDRAEIVAFVEWLQHGASRSRRPMACARDGEPAHDRPDA